MRRSSWTVCAMAALLFGGTAAAQEPGSLLVGGFGQYTRLDAAYKAETGFHFGQLGWGGRIGAFMTPEWWLEAEGSYASINNATGGGSLKYGPLSARLMYKFPTTSPLSLHAGIGGVLNSVRPNEDDRPVRGQGTYNYGVEGNVGASFGVGGLNFRVDGLADYLPNPSATNLRAQVGLEFWPNIASWFGTGGTMANSSAPWAPVAWWDVMTDPLPGTLEIGGFGQWTKFDDNAGAESGAGRPTAIRPKSDFFGNIGFGGRAGVFLSDTHWEVEGDGAYMQADRVSGTGAALAGPRVKYSTFALRMNYNIPIRAGSQFILGGGVVRTNYNFGETTGGYIYNYGASGLAGIRWGIANRTAIRLDGIADYMPTPSNLNLSARLGLSFLLGGMRREVMCTYAGLENIPASSPSCVPPPPPPPPVVMCSYAGLGNIPATDPACVAPKPVVVVIDTAAITGPIYFDYDKSNIRPDAEATLQRKLPWLNANPGMRIRIEGNADERGSDEYNIALGQRRAASAKKWLVDHGIDAGRFDIVSYGEERPVCREHDESCWQQNRRDDFIIITIGSDNIKPPME